MAADGKLVQGQISEDPSSEDLQVEQLLLGLLRALVNEQREAKPAVDLEGGVDIGGTTLV